MGSVSFTLASASPRRRDLLRRAGFSFLVAPTEVEERVLEGESAEVCACRLAAAKAQGEGVVLAADTLVHIDNEILGMIGRILSGIETDKEHLATEVIREVGPGGNYMAHDHTVKFMRSEFYMPRVSERDRFEKWQKKGALDARQRANKIAREILEQTAEPILPDHVSAAILSRFGHALQPNALGRGR